MKRLQSKNKRAPIIYERLIKQYPDVRCTLDRVTPAQFLLANIISPQCTDIVANSVSVELWKKYQSIENIAGAPLSDLARTIRKCGMYNVKSKNIKFAAEMLVDEFDGKLPDEIEKLRKFPGIGRKTALVILQEVFGKVEGIIIDTHNIRIAKLAGLVSGNSADKIEKELMVILPRKYWQNWSHLMVRHGREVCVARRPKCDSCVICELCAYGRRREYK